MIRHLAGHSRICLKTKNDDEDVPPEVTLELIRLKVLGGPFQVPSVDEQVPQRDAHSQKSCDWLDPRLVGEGRTLCRQDALIVIPRTALRRGTKTFRDKFVDVMKNGRVKCRFEAGVARDVRYDVRAKTLRMIVSLAATRDGKSVRAAWRSATSWRYSCMQALMRSWRCSLQMACWSVTRASSC